MAQDRSEVLAQSRDEGAAEIIVTARRSEERLQDVPISITVFSQSDLTKRNIVSAADLGTYTPSLSAVPRYGNENATFAIRGFVQDGLTSPSVAVYFADVVSLRGQAPTGGGANGAGPGAFFDLQNVQVLKGPQGTLFGRNTTGGAILLVPQKPTAEFEGYVEGSIGNFDMRRFQGVINVPLADSVKLRLGVDRQLRDGYVRNRSGIGPRDFSDTDYWSFRGSLLLDITPDLENYTVASYTRSNTNGLIVKVFNANVGPNCAPNVAGPGAASGAALLLAPLACSQQLLRSAQQGYGYHDAENSAANPYVKIKQWQAINTTTWTASDAITLKNILSYGEYRQAFTGNLFGDNIVLPATFGPLAGRPFGFVTNYQNGSNYFVSQRTFTEELQIQGQAFGNRLKFQAGAYYEKASPLDGYQSSLGAILLSCTNAAAFQCIDILRNPVTGAPGGFMQISYSKYRFENIGFYGQGTFNLTDQLAITGGIRYTIDETTAFAATQQLLFLAPNTPTALCVSTGAPATSVAACETVGKQKSKRPTWLIDLDYKPNDNVLLYAKYARGYRQGSVNAGNTLINTWGPEKVDSYELGAKLSFRGQIQGYLNFAAFYNDFANQQLAATLVPDGTVPGRAPAQAIVNGGESRIQGFEIDAGIDPVEGLRLTAGYAYLDTKLKSYSPPSFPGYLPPGTTSKVGGSLSYSPRHKLTASAVYTLPLDESVGRVSIGATYTHTSSQISSAASPFGVLPSTDLLNLNFDWTGVAGSALDLSVFATNVTNVKYYAAIGGSYVSQGFETGILAPPRMYGVRARVNF